MKGNATVLSNFKAAIPLEATFNLQCRMNKRVLDYLGVKKLKGKMNEFGDDGHRFLKRVTKQFFFLSGDGPVDASYQPGAIGTPPSITAMFDSLLAMEISICAEYEQHVEVARLAMDDKSRNLWEHLIKWHRGHQDWLEKQLRVIQGLGEDEYIAENI